MSDTIDEALDRFALAVEAEKDQREREQDDLRFQFPDQQWTEYAKTGRAGGLVKGTGVSLPERPMLTIPSLDQPIQLILNQERSAKLGVTVHALSEDATDDTAEVIQGLYRRIEVDSRAALARTWGFDRAVKVGRGAYRVLTEYDPEGGHPSDQRIVIKRILYQGAVYLDPFAQEPDWSDGEWAFLIEDMPIAKYRRKFKDAEIATMDEDGLIAMGIERPGWINGDKAARTVRVAEYWRKVYTTKTHPAEGEWAGKDEDVATVLWSTIDAKQELCAAKEWPGTYLPLVPVIGREMQPVDGKRRWVGVIGPNKDAARVKNYAASSAVEMAALEPKAPFDVDPEEIEGYEAWWEQANVRSFPYLPRRKYLHGQMMGPIQRVQVDASRLGPSMLLLQQSGDWIHSGTGAFEPSLGQDRGGSNSGRKVLALQQQHDQGTSNYLDNLAELSLTLEAKIVLDLLPKVYDRPGRVLRILGLEDVPKTVMLNQPFIPNEQTGKLQGLPQPEPAMPGQPPGPLPDTAKHFDLTKGRYGVTVSVGKSYDSRLQQGAEEIGQIMEANPAMVPIIGPTYFKFRDAPGMREIADLLKKMRDHEMPWLADEKDKKNSQMQAQQLQQENTMLKQQLQQAGKMLETKQIEQQGKADVTHLHETAETLRNRENNETKLAVAELGAKVDRLQLFYEERARLGTQTHDTALAAASAGHDEHMAGIQQQAASQQADQGHQQALEQGDQAHQNTLEQGQQAAALAPQPQAGEGA